ncbi:replication initiator protein [Microviridae sp.]|nr:replication initiator protein [Microviridae sp.]
MCRDCRLFRAREWAIRCYHEGQLHQESCFIDLTFAVEPPSVSKRDLQLFFKRLRKSLPGTKIRYFAVGEYGEKFSRPHYHVCIFGWSPKDRYFWDKSPKGTILYRSPHLETVWTAGHVTVSDITAEAAGYAARYTLKKITGEKQEPHYGGREPEFNTSSLGLGKGWIEKYYSDVCRDAFVVFKGKECPVPSYYSTWIKNNQPEAWEKLQAKQKDRYDQLPYESGERLHHAAQARDSRTKTLKRDLETTGSSTGSPFIGPMPNRPLDR